MSNRMKFAVWFRDGRLFRVRPPGWPKNTELSFTDKQDMIEWARAARLMLADARRDGRRTDARPVGEGRD